MTKVLITGTFDIIHPGHLNLIKQAKELGDFIVAIIARDQNVIKVKGRESYFNEADRVENLKKLGLVDKVILGDVVDPYKMIIQEKPDIIALGYDQQAFVEGLIDLRANSKLHFDIKRLVSFKEDFCKGKNLRKAIDRAQLDEDDKTGFLLLDKESNWTSHDVVAKLRSITKIKQIGHTGTLDPFATGLLICAIGNATKMVGMFDLLPKTYEATIKLGIISDTYDRTGQLKAQNLIELSSIKLKTDVNQLKEILSSFIGKQLQIPPMYSAKKVGGKKLYDLARQGKEIERKPNEIEIYKIEFLGLKDDIFNIKVKCSSGTYIRTLAYDLGQKLGVGAVLWELKRTAIGSFNLEQAIKLDQLTNNNFGQNLIIPLEALKVINQGYLEGFLR
ncbi:MAG: tRNA pseudouridine(55) synthase TruB [Patescibacteria group bacterium]|jgi:tRNA pseudouridine55 synthase